MSDEQQFRPPSSLKGRTFRDVESEVQSESTIEPACKQRRKLPVIALVLFMVLTLGVGTAMIFAGSQETVQNSAARGSGSRGAGGPGAGRNGWRRAACCP